MKKCNFCIRNKSNLWIKKFKYWNLGVGYNLHTLGNLVIVFKKHKELFVEVTEKEVIELLRIIKFSVRILNRQFKPDWFNVQQNGNWEKHLHVHIIPRYKKQRKFNDTIFVDKNFGQPVIYSAAIENEESIRKLTHSLQKCI